MKPEELMKYAGIIEQAKKQQRAKKLELNNVRVLEDKQIEKQANPIVKALVENKEALNEIVKVKEEDNLGLKDEFNLLIDKVSNVSFRLNSVGMLGTVWKYIASNSSKGLIKFQNITKPEEFITVQSPNEKVFLLFFKNLANIEPIARDDINEYITLLNTKLGLNISKAILKSFTNYKSKTVSESKASSPIRVSGGKGLLRPSEDSLGVGSTAPLISKNIQKGKHGNLLYNNTTLMKKLQLMLSAQEAGNDGLKKDIAMFLDEALKRHLIADWEHKHNMKIFVLSKNKRSKGNQ
jgi:hypothetical protein